MKLAPFAVAAGLALAAGCADDGRQATPAPSPSHGVHSAASISPPMMTVADTLRLGRSIEAVRGNSARLVFGSKEPGDVEAGSVVSVDVETGARTVVAHSEFPRGLVNWAGASGDWTVFTDQSHRQGDQAMDVLWRVVAVNPRLHRRKILLSNGDQPDPWVPWLGSNDDYIYWSSAESDPGHTAREWIFRSDWQGPRTLLRHAVLTPGSESIAGGSMVYLGPAASKSAGRAVGGDCWRVPLAGGSPEALTHTGLADGCASDGTWIVWECLVAPGTTPAPSEGFLDNPYEVWAARVEQPEPELLHRGYLPGGRPLAQDGFAVYAGTNGHLVIQDLADPRSTSSYQKIESSRGVTIGDRLAILGRSGLQGGNVADVVELQHGRQED